MRWLKWAGCAAALISLSASHPGWAQTSQTKKQPVPAQPQGYLNRSAPPNLRFSAPPRPPVATLPAAGIQSDQSPVFVDKFLEADTSGNRQINPALDVTDISVPGNSAVTPAPKPSNGKPINLPARPVQQEADLLKLLVKYFDHAGAGVTSTNQGPRFRPPLKQEPELVELAAAKEVSKPVTDASE